MPILLPLERSCNKSLYLDNDLSFIAFWPRRSFSSNSQGACALCHIQSIQLFVWTSSPRPRTLLYALQGWNERKNTASNTVSKLDFLEYQVTCSKSEVAGYNNSVIALVQRFILHIWTTATFRLTSLSECMHLLVHPKTNLWTRADNP